MTSYRKQILGYTNKLTVRPGEGIEFKVSVEGGATYEAQLVRLINGDIHSKAANFKEVEIDSTINGTYEGRKQSTAPGSCIVVEDAARLGSLDEATVTITLMPTMPKHGTQHVIGRWDDQLKRGWSLHLNDRGELAFTIADNNGVSSLVTTRQPLIAKTWYTAVLCVSWITKVATLTCRATESSSYQMNVMNESAVMKFLSDHPSTSCPLLIAAGFGGRDGGARVIPVGCFNGRVEAPVIYRGILSDGEVSKILAGERPSSSSNRICADWDFSEGIDSTRITDRSFNELHGHTHNLPLRGVKSSRWNGSTMECQRAPDQYGAIHFHSDDLYDCGWLTDISYRLPDGMRSGIYALRLRRSGESVSSSSEEYLPFFVAPTRGVPQAGIAFIVPTHTYLAYGNIRGIEEGRRNAGLSVHECYENYSMGPGSMEYAMLAEEHRELGYSLYDRHADGSPVHFSSWLRPILNVRPKSMLWTLCADLLLIDWLEAKSFDYDVITDDLLHQEGADLLKGYRAVVTGNHPEYTTTAQVNALESYTGQGGRLMYLGGNGFYWRIAADKAAIELRRGRTGSGMWQSEVGESSMALSGEVGGIWRELGRPPQRLVGVGTIAWGPGASHYRISPDARDSRAAFILQGVEGDVIGDFGIFFGGAAGQEIDAADSRLGTPAHAVVLARSENLGEKMWCVFEEMWSLKPDMELYRHLIRAEVVFFETPNGGAVFSVGSMAWCGSLSHNGYNNNISKITENVLRTFGRAQTI